MLLSRNMTNRKIYLIGSKHLVMIISNLFDIDLQEELMNKLTTRDKSKL